MVSVLLAPQLFEPGVASAIEPVEFIANGILQVVILMILLGLVERTGRHDRRLDRLLEALLNRRLRGFRRRPLLVTMIDPPPAGLAALIPDLPILPPGIGAMPTPVEQLLPPHLGLAA